MSLLRPLLRTAGRPRLALVLVLVLAGSMVLAPSAFANFATPKAGGSPNADNIDSLYKIILWMAVVVFAVVEGALLYAVFKFRAKRHPVATQIHGNTRLEIGWTAGAAGILVILTIVTFIKLPGIINAPNSNSNVALSASLSPAHPPNGKTLTVCVTGRQFIWRYTYGYGCNKNYFAKQLPYSYQEMVVPSGTTINLLIQSSDVIHAWWVPKLGGKVDAVPGYTTYTWFKVPTPNHYYYGQCAQLCGRQHAFMTALVKVVTPAAYKSWLQHQTSLIHDQNNQVTQLRQQLIKQGSLTSNGIF
ncbi:MAG TPA: cytochrome c oxidase subunit II [Solirubrobacteraceae bacterium]|jgi:cytochrome c oxidase subunit 2|nr:cytochrome c oxidase subunit II [Solirubrobacteraceae bacterium]